VSDLGPLGRPHGHDPIEQVGADGGTATSQEGERTGAELHLPVLSNVF